MTRRPSSALLPIGVALLAACSGDAPGVVAPQPAPERSAARLPSTSVARAEGDVVPGQYIVLFRQGVAGGRGRAAEKAAGGALLHTYTAVVNGFSARLGPLAVAALRADPDILLVEPDPVVTATATQSGAPWGLDRIDQAALPLSTTFTYANDGSGVTVYIVDTGINTAHVDFGGRAVPGYDAVTPGGTSADCHGHGTHVAGTVGGTTYGVAKGARLVAVRVLDCSGNGTGSGILAGLDWIVARKQAAPATPMVVNMSLGGSASSTLDQAVANVINAGITAVVAAGNDGADACNTSPARLAPAITVGATDSGDRFASWSNRGSCIDISGPGVSIVAPSYSSTTGTRTMSGTSMATPHVAGAAALYLKASPASTPAQVASALTGNAVTGRILSLPAATVNRLLNVAFLAPAPAPAPAPTLSVSPDPAALTVGGSATLTATITNPVAGATLTWISRNTAVARVAASGATTGAVTGVAAGGTYVIAKYVAGGITVLDSARVSVTAPSATAGAIVSATGKGCVSIASTDVTKAIHVVVASCQPDAPRQTWTAPASGQTGAITLVAGSTCLAGYSTGKDGAVVGTTTCNPSSVTQQWTLTAGGELRLATGYCATAVTASWGIRVLMRSCNGSVEQRWTR